MRRWLQLSERSSSKPIIVNMGRVQTITADPETTLWFDDSSTLTVRESLAELRLLLQISLPRSEKKPAVVTVLHPQRAKGKPDLRRPRRDRTVGILTVADPFCADWLPEQRGLETSGSREIYAKETPREYWRNFALNSVRILQRMSLLSVRYNFRR